MSASLSSKDIGGGLPFNSDESGNGNNLDERYDDDFLVGYGIARGGGGISIMTGTEYGARGGVGHWLWMELKIVKPLP